MNYFAATDIYLPENFRDYFHAYCLTRYEGSKNNPEDSPFPRMVDMWFLGICIAVKKELNPVFDKKGKTYKAIEGSVLGTDIWRSNALMLLAIAHEGTIEIANNPNDMMKIANAYAIAGLTLLISILEDRGGDTALDYISDIMVDYMS